MNCDILSGGVGVLHEVGGLNNLLGGLTFQL